MRMLLATVAAATFALALPLAAQTPAATAQSDDFVKKAAGGGIAEVQLGKLAQTRAQDPRVKQFGQHMVDDHTKANEKLKATLSQEGLSVPTEMDPEARQSYDRLSKLSGTAFDKAYMQDMVEDHRKDLAEFQNAAKTERDPGIKKFAQDSLPMLQQHLKMAEQIAGR